MRQARPGGGCGACLAEEVRGGLQHRRRALAQDRAAQRGVRGRVRVDAGEQVGADGVEQRHVGRQELALVDVHERAQRQRRLILVRAPERMRQPNGLRVAIVCAHTFLTYFPPP